MFSILNKWPLMGLPPGPTSGASGVGAAGAKQNHAQVDKNDVQVSGNGNVGLGVSSNHILQFPKQPIRDDGKWVALGSLLGALLGKISSASVIKKARRAEDKWRTVNDSLYDRGKDQWAKAPPEWEKMLKAEADLDADVDWNTNARDVEQTYAYSLDNCNNELHEKLCQYVQCGYKPDYYGIATRAVAAAEAAIAKEKRDIMKQLNRYAAGKCCDMNIRLATAKVMSVVGTVSKQREEERRKQWEINNELIFKGTELMEKHRQSRLNDALNFDKHKSDLTKFLYNQRQANYIKLTELGGEFLASAGKNYGWLADSLRKTAEKDTSGLTALGATIAGVIALFFCGGLSMCRSDDDGCGGAEKPPHPPRT